MVQTRRSKRNQPQAMEDIVSSDTVKPINKKIELIEKSDEKKNNGVLRLGCTDIIEKKSTGIDLSALEKEVDSSDNLEKSIDNEKKSTTDIKLGVAEKSTNSDSNIKKDDWRIPRSDDKLH